jgi:hypothetical protein
MSQETAVTDLPVSPALDDATVGAFVDAAARVQGLVVAPEWHDAVVSHFKATAGAAGLVLAFELADEVDAAPVFSA